MIAITNHVNSKYPAQKLVGTASSAARSVVGGVNVSEARAILVTNPSGVNAKTALERLANACKDISPGRTTSVKSFEEEMLKLHLDHFPHDFPHSDSENGDPQVDPMIRLLQRPLPYLRELWKETLNFFRENIVVGPMDDLILNFHSVYFHTWTEEWFSCVDLAALNNWKASGIQKGVPIQFTSVITLIDDIYDVLHRLQELGQVASGLLSEVPPEKLGPATVGELLRLLRWREVEIAFASQFARSMSLPHYVVAAKHDGKAVARLVTGTGIPIYLSHPISKPRRARDLGDDSLWEELVPQVQFLSARLTDSTSLAPVFPTAIDELRLKIRKVQRMFEDAVNEDLPALGKRWDYPNNTALCADTDSTLDPLDPFGRLRGIEREAYITQMKPHLQELRAQVLRQINSRDHSLVAQCETLVVWRPYFQGVTASGVFEEIRYRNRLRQYHLESPQAGLATEQAAAPCFIIHSETDVDDLARRRIKDLAKLLVENFTWFEKTADESSHRRELEILLSESHDLSSLFRNVTAGRHITGSSLRSAVEPAVSPLRLQPNSPPLKAQPGALDESPATRSLQRVAALWNETALSLDQNEAIEPLLTSADVIRVFAITENNFQEIIQEVVNHTENFLRTHRFSANDSKVSQVAG